MEIKKIIEQSKKYIGKEVTVEGWIRFNRGSKAIGFIELFDGTKLHGIQLVYKEELDEFKMIKALPLFSALSVTGTLILGRAGVEIVVNKIEHVHAVEKELVIGKNEMNLETLREYAHLRPRTKLFQSIMKIRSIAAQSVHKFYSERNYNYVHAPIITSNDAEGGGEAFIVKTSDDETFWSNQGSLTVSGQLHAEGYAQAFTKTYTFGPTFRAENSNTSRHAAEFWMIEPEVAYADYFDVMQMGEDITKFVAHSVLEKAKEELIFLSKYFNREMIKDLTDLIQTKFGRITYKEAIDILNKAVESGVKFQNNKVEFGTDLDSDHEKYLVEIYNKGIPAYVYNYPSEIKSFYMYQNNDGTARGFDLLVPRIGEMIGGSQREESYDKLISTIKEKNMQESVEGLWWYTDLRKQGYAPSTGFGLGFERMVMLMTGVENIRDTLPFPRTPGKLNF